MTAITRYLQHRRDTSANWTASTTPPLAGQICFTTDVFYTGTDQMKFKVGDGIQTWSNLDYMPIGTGASLTFTNGLTLTGTNIRLGGTLIANTQVLGGGFELDFGTVVSPLLHCDINGSQYCQFVSGNNYLSTYAGLGTNVGASPDGLTFADFGAYISGQTIANNGVNNVIVLTDSISSKGAVYAADYSANFTPESLVSKRYTTTTFVPYTGATSDVDLGAFIMNAKAFHAKGTAGAGHMGYRFQSVDAGGSANETTLFADSSGNLKYVIDNAFYTTFSTSANTANRVYTFPNLSGTLATINGGQTFTSATWNASSISTTYTDAKIKGSASVTNGILFQNGVDTASTSSNLTWDGSSLILGSNRQLLLSNNSAQTNSRSWRFFNDSVVFGDFLIQQSAGSNQTFTANANVWFYINNTGRVGLGNTLSPTAWLHLPASTTAAASLRIASGTAPTTPNQGDVWNDGTYYNLNAGLAITDANNISFGTTTGTKIGTATTQKIGFWNTAPIVQPTTAVAAGTLVSNAGTGLTSTDTIDGYTLLQVVKALRNTGILA